MSVLDGRVTGEQVKAAALAVGLTYVPHHACGVCGAWVAHSIHDENLFFEPACNCSWSPPEPRDWQSMADEINMQNDEWRIKLMQRWGWCRVDLQDSLSIPLKVNRRVRK